MQAIIKDISKKLKILKIKDNKATIGTDIRLSELLEKGNIVKPKRKKG